VSLGAARLADHAAPPIRSLLWYIDICLTSVRQFEHQFEFANTIATHDFERSNPSRPCTEF
jgi:hypothetical protein